MLFSLTKKEVQILKKILPTVKLNAYDIQAYQRILHSLDNPYDQLSSCKQSKQPNIIPIIDDPVGYVPEQPKPLPPDKTKSKTIKHTSVSPVITTSVVPDNTDTIDDSGSDSIF